MKREIENAMAAIRTEHGDEALKRACLHIIERGLLVDRDVTHLTRDGLCAARICTAAGEDSEALMYAIAELFSEKKPLTEVCAHLTPGGMVELYSNDNSIQVSIIDECTDVEEEQEAAKKAMEELEKQVDEGNMFCIYD